MVGHCRDTWWLGTAGILDGWALQGALRGDLVVGHCRETWWLGTAGILGGWSPKPASGRARTTSTFKSNNPTARVGKNLRLTLGLRNSRSPGLLTLGNTPHFIV